MPSLHLLAPFPLPCLLKLAHHLDFPPHAFNTTFARTASQTSMHGLTDGECADCDLS